MNKTPLFSLLVGGLIMNTGWIKLHRKITNWEWYTNIPVKVLYFHLLITANHEDARWQGREIKRGELITSVNRLAEETGLTVKQVRNALKKLNDTGEILSQGTNSYTLIKCLNYGVYQAREIDEGQTNGTRGTNGGQTRDNKQEYKNNKNKKNLLRKPSFDIEEIARRAKFNDDYDI